MQVNPVWLRELRARWRGWRAFALLFAYVTILAGVLIWRYHDFLNSYQAQEITDPRARLSILGHELFSTLIWLQAAMWMLIAPILTATSITAERERGLLEGLQLSRLQAGQIVRGKLFSALSFCALLIIVTLPIEAVCFLMGGVSPGEFFAALALHASTALACAALGLAVSAWSRKSLEAMAIAVVGSVVWVVGSYVALALALGAFTPLKNPLQLFVLELFGKTNPILAAYTIVESNAISIRGTSGKIDLLPWIISIAFSALSTLLWLWLATRGAGKILRDPLRLEWQSVRRELQTQYLTGDEKQVLAPQEVAVKAARRWELGFLSRLQFSNPILGREVRACFRPRSSSPIMVVVAVLLAPFALFAYGVGLYLVITDSFARVTLGQAILVICLLLTILLCAILSATTFAREREQSTLVALRLSLLSPRELLVGKMGSPLVICSSCSLVFLPLLLPCVRSVAYSGSNAQGLSLSQVVGALSIIASTAWCMTLTGLFFSWFNKRVVAATCWTVGVLFALLVGLPALVGQTSHARQPQLAEFFRCWHPGFAIMAMFDRRFATYFYEDGPQYRASTLADAASSSFILFFIGAILLFILWRGVLTSHEGES